MWSAQRSLTEEIPSSASRLILHQGSRCGTVIKTIPAARTLVLQHLKPVLNILHLGMDGGFRTRLSAQPAGNANILLDLHLHRFSSSDEEPPSARVGVGAQGFSRKSNTSSIYRSCSATDTDKSCVDICFMDIPGPSDEYPAIARLIFHSSCPDFTSSSAVLSAFLTSLSHTGRQRLVWRANAMVCCEA